MKLPSLKTLSKKQQLTTPSGWTAVRRHLKLIYSDEILYFKAIEFLREATVQETLNIQKNTFGISANGTLKDETSRLTRIFPLYNI